MECNLKTAFFIYLLGPCLLSFFLGLISAVAVKVWRFNKEQDSINLNRNTDGRTIYRFKD